MDIVRDDDGTIVTITTTQINGNTTIETIRQQRGTTLTDLPEDEQTDTSLITAERRITRNSYVDGRIVLTTVDVDLPAGNIDPERRGSTTLQSAISERTTYSYNSSGALVRRQKITRKARGLLSLRSNNGNPPPGNPNSLMVSNAETEIWRNGRIITHIYDIEAGNDRTTTRPDTNSPRSVPPQEQEEPEVFTVENIPFNRVQRYAAGEQVNISGRINLAGEGTFVGIGTVTGTGTHTPFSGGFVQNGTQTFSVDGTFVGTGRIVGDGTFSGFKVPLKQKEVNLGSSPTTELLAQRVGDIEGNLIAGNFRKHNLIIPLHLITGELKPGTIISVARQDGDRDIGSLSGEVILIEEDRVTFGANVLIFGTVAGFGDLSPVITPPMQRLQDVLCDENAQSICDENGDLICV